MLTAALWVVGGVVIGVFVGIGLVFISPPKKIGR